MSDSDHVFGGPWTEIKLDAVEYYLKCYTTALKRVGFQLFYIDAFAGTGTRTSERVEGGLFDGGGPLRTVRETLAGSALRALAVGPAFDRLLFIEKDPKRCEALDEIRAMHPGRHIEIIPGDANAVLCDLVRQEPWVRRDQSSVRGVVFLDPYSLQVDWKTLQALASTRILDVWYLFPIRDVIRQLAHDFNGIGPKELMLDRMLGPEWRELYRIEPQHGGSLFDGPVEPELRRVVSQRQFEQWLKERLGGEFPFVSEPLPLLTTPSRQAFSLFLGVSNPKKSALDLAEKFVRYVNRNFAPGASRRKSGRGTPGR
jgi:three-Cys-motif partner protein